jgi:hypothetical protein
MSKLGLPYLVPGYRDRLACGSVDPDAVPPLDLTPQRAAGTVVGAAGWSGHTYNGARAVLVRQCPIYAITLSVSLPGCGMFAVAAGSVVAIGG